MFRILQDKQVHFIVVLIAIKSLERLQDLCFRGSRLVDQSATQMSAAKVLAGANFMQ